MLPPDEAALCCATSIDTYTGLAVFEIWCWREENAALAHVINPEDEPLRAVLKGDVEPMENLKLSISLALRGKRVCCREKGEGDYREKRQNA